jgi:hypothetical protein
MTLGLKLVTRVAVFSALVYVLSWMTAHLANVSFMFFVVFSAGFIWGGLSGAMVGIIGMGLWTMFNPFGPAHLYVMLAQVVGASFSGWIGALFRRLDWNGYGRFRLAVSLVVASVICTVLYYFLVNTVDAWLFGPFWPRFITSGLFSLISVGSNALIFPLLFGVTRYLYIRESGLRWQSV